MAAQDARFLTAVIVPSKQELQLQTVPIAVAAFPSKAGNQLIKALGSTAPLSDLRHLKRVRKAPDDGSLLEAILCALPDAAAQNGESAEQPPVAPDPDQAGTSGRGAEADPTSSYSELAPDGLPADLRDLYTQHGGVRLRLLHGAVAPPQTRQQWEAWTKLWPITWRIPDHGTPVTEETPVDERTQRYFEHHMRHALQLAAASGVDNAAVIVSPPSLTPVAEAVDGSTAHPLRHAVMAVIQAASERDLALWPPSANGEPEASGGDSGAEADCLGAERDLQDPACTASGASAVEQGAAGPQEEGQQPCPACDPGAAAGGDGTAAASGEELASKRPRLGAGPQEAQAPSAGTRPYMCTGYDCFVVMEPCIMCAMALVHSRVQRVIFCRPDPVHGALGGERRLHACRSLNHNYEVFRMELKKD